MAKNHSIEPTHEDLLYQALEFEQGGVKVYETAITCALTEYLRHEWKECLEDTRHHEQVLPGVFDAMGLDPKAPPRNPIVGCGLGEALVVLMNKAKATVTLEQAEMVAWEAVAMAERQSDPTTLQPNMTSGGASQVPGQEPSRSANYSQHGRDVRAWRNGHRRAAGPAPVLPPDIALRSLRAPDGAPARRRSSSFGVPLRQYPAATATN